MKVFSKILDEKRKERFLAEVKFMKDKHHPSIMRQYDEGVFIQGDAEFPFVIMEYLPYTLEEGIKKGIDISGKKTRPHSCKAEQKEFCLPFSHAQGGDQ